LKDIANRETSSNEMSLEEYEMSLEENKVTVELILGENRLCINRCKTKGLLARENRYCINR